MQYIVRFGRLWIFILFLCVVMYFAHHNKSAAVLEFPPWINYASVPVYLLVIGSIAFGAGVACIYFGFDNVSKALLIRRLKKDLAAQSPLISRGTEGAKNGKQSPTVV